MKGNKELFHGVKEKEGPNLIQEQKRITE